MMNQLPILVIVTAVKITLILVVLLTAIAYTVLMERKVLGFIQLRYGPNRVGPWGLLQPLPESLTVYGYKGDLTVAALNQGVIADVNVGLLYVFAVGSLSVYGAVLGGWASNNKYSLLGGLRRSAQMISYELALGLSVIGVLMLAGSLRRVKMVEAPH